jgi:type II secretory pathway pseudopilin PulG
VSNVLIGIIGVILFIGLALAGALFLGPRFQESTNNSRASAAVQAVAQVSNAANMYKVQEGKDVAGTTAAPATLQSESYLKSIPSNPTSGGAIVLDAVPASSTTIRYVTMPLGTNAEAVCEAINKQSGVDANTTLAGNQAPAAPTGTQGCSLATTGTPSVSTYTAFSAI